MTLPKEMQSLGIKAKSASRVLACLPMETKNKILTAMALALQKNSSQIIKANNLDIANAKKEHYKTAFLERLVLNKKKLSEMSESLSEIAALTDPVGEVIKAWRRPNGLWIHKVRVPIGVIAIIYESRPNVTSDCIGLCLKSGNACILKGGSEALNSNMAISRALCEVTTEFGLIEGCINMVVTRSHQAIPALLQHSDLIDLVIPRGGEGLINRVASCSRVPVIKHYKGICHVYVDEWADLNSAENICFNAKVQRPGVCNAMESLLVNKDIAVRFLPGMAKKFTQAGVELRGCELTRKIVKNCVLATEKDYRTEYLDLILSVKVVNSLHDAITHINTYGSHHSDAIVSENYVNAMQFLNQVDSACVYVNASTRFTDGYQFGLGAEIGISTDKLHARGPMGLEELTTYKYMVFGNGQIRK